MENKTIYDKANDGSWLVVSEGGYRRLYVDPNHVELVNKWSLSEIVQVEPGKNSHPFHIRITNIIRDEYANVK